jgi:hypothetical protein
LLVALSACQPSTPPATPTSLAPPTAAPKPTAAVPASPVAAASPAPAQPSPVAAPASPAATSTQPPPAVGTGRVEILNAAEAAYASGNSEAAAGLFERAINTPPASSEATAASVAITDYAHFRAMVALLAAGREDEARAHMEALRSREPSAPLPRLADQFWNQYSMTASVKAACAQLQPQIASQGTPVLATLQSIGVNADPTRLCSG